MMLGVQRSSVTLAATKLKACNVIDYRRGQVTILDRPELERSACECYGVAKRGFDRLLGQPLGSTKFESSRNVGARRKALCVVAVCPLGRGGGFEEQGDPTTDGPPVGHRRISENLCAAQKGAVGQSPPARVDKRRRMQKPASCQTT
jgi:hypothetical protein